MTLFSELSLRPEIQSALAAQGYTTPTPIQAQAVPAALQGRDVLGIAQTGTGKTAAFTLPMLERLSAKPRAAGKPPVRALILTPTRELASQIGDSITAYGAGLGITHAVIFGGVGPKPQTDALARGIDIVVATPGRLLDLMNQGHARFDKLEFFVLDEADRMLDMGFIRDVKKITAQLPRDKQSLFFSATMPDEVAGLSRGLLRDPVRVEVTPVATTAERIEQSVIFVPAAEKRQVLVDFLRGNPDAERAIVFTRTKHGADRVTKHLERADIRSAAIHGNKSQNARTAALEGFKTGAIRVLVATDIAARGIDVDGVSHVVNFELPNEPESYVHRIGRTARAGKSGVAIAFCDDGEERAYLRQIEKLTRRSIPVGTRPAATETVVYVDPPRPPLPPRHGKPGQGRGGNTGRPQGHGKPAQAQAHAGTGGRPQHQGGNRSQAAGAAQGRPAQAQASRPAQSQASRPAQSQASRPAQSQASRPAQPQNRPAQPQAARTAQSQNRQGSGFGDLVAAINPDAQPRNRRTGGR